MKRDVHPMNSQVKLVLERSKPAKTSVKIGDFLLAPCATTALIRPSRRTFSTNNSSNTMAKALSKSQIAATIADRSGVTKKTASEILDMLAELAYKNAKNTFTLPGIGKLVLVNRKARVGRNPATGEQINIPAKKVVKFRVAKACKDAILGSK
jgi:DNA-binding protein HU-beta